MTLDQNMLNMIRRIMPNLLAQSIIGAQPMTGPAGSIFNLRKRYGSKRIRGKQGVRPTPQQFNQFLRLNNRKRTQSHDELNAAGYPSVFIDLPAGVYYEEVNLWLTEQIGADRFISINARYWFTNAQDAMLARMGWP
jgi:Major capsid protein Gp23